eukprot:scaffold1847_cov343-Prasinococcus_capsulatus_cf.AAC.2
MSAARQQELAPPARRRREGEATEEEDGHAAAAFWQRAGQFAERWPVQLALGTLVLFLLSRGYNFLHSLPDPARAIGNDTALGLPAPAARAPPAALGAAGGIERTPFDAVVYAGDASRAVRARQPPPSASLLCPHAHGDDVLTPAAAFCAGDGLQAGAPPGRPWSSSPGAVSGGDAAATKTPAASAAALASGADAAGFCAAGGGRLLPRVFLAGVQKCGTSSIFYDLLRRADAAAAAAQAPEARPLLAPARRASADEPSWQSKVRERGRGERASEGLCKCSEESGSRSRERTGTWPDGELAAAAAGPCEPQLAATCNTTPGHRLSGCRLCSPRACRAAVGGGLAPAADAAVAAAGPAAGRPVVDLGRHARWSELSLSSAVLSQEPHFFNVDERYKRGAQFYGSHFPECGTGSARAAMTIDATPNYFFEPVRMEAAPSCGCTRS